jgi:iron complex outermembrane recepter protein
MTFSDNKILNFRNYFIDYNTSDWSSVYTWEDLGRVSIAYSPSVTASAEIEINPVRNTALRLNGKFVGRQYFDNTMSLNRSIDPYFVSNMIAEYSINKLKFADIALRLQVNNLFNTLYENNAYGGMWAEDSQEKTWAYFFPQAGINFMCGITLTF